jgi:hypothetical protein
MQNTVTFSKVMFPANVGEEYEETKAKLYIPFLFRPKKKMLTVLVIISCHLMVIADDAIYCSFF